MYMIKCNYYITILRHIDIKTPLVCNSNGHIVPAKYMITRMESKVQPLYTRIYAVLRATNIIIYKIYVALNTKL